MPKADHTPPDFLKAVSHKFYLLYSWVFCPNYIVVSDELPLHWHATDFAETWILKLSNFILWRWVFTKVDYYLFDDKKQILAVCLDQNSSRLPKIFDAESTKVYFRFFKIVFWILGNSKVKTFILKRRFSKSLAYLETDSYSKKLAKLLLLHFWIQQGKVFKNILRPLSVCSEFFSGIALRNLLSHKVRILSNFKWQSQMFWKIPRFRISGPKRPKMGPKWGFSSFMINQCAEFFWLSTWSYRSINKGLKLMQMTLVGKILFLGFWVQRALIWV